MQTIKNILYKDTHREGEKSPFIIAEMSGNHGGDLNQALKLVDAASEAGADCIKLQTFTPESMTLDIEKDEFKVTKKDSLWYGRKLFDLFKEGQTPIEWHKPIFEYAKEKGIICFSSAFDEKAVDLLEDLDAPAYKIASFENVDTPLIEYAASTGKPLIISTGMATLDEIEDAVSAAEKGGCKQLTILKCTSSYPAPPEDSNLATIMDIKKYFKCEAGLSDHTLGIGAAITATALGASVIEKHLTLSRDNNAIDSAFSMEPDELKLLMLETKNAALSVGKVFYGPTKVEESSRTKRRSVYIVEDIKKEKYLIQKNLRRIRPGLGIKPKFYNDIIGKTAAVDISRVLPLIGN